MQSCRKRCVPAHMSYIVSFLAWTRSEFSAFVGHGDLLTTVISFQQVNWFINTVFVFEPHMPTSYLDAICDDKSIELTIVF